MNFELIFKKYNDQSYSISCQSLSNVHWSKEDLCPFVNSHHIGDWWYVFWTRTRPLSKRRRRKNFNQRFKLMRLVIILYIHHHLVDKI